MEAAEYRREFRELFRLAGPVAAAQAGTQMMGLVDVAVLGRLGARELAASGVANAVFFALSVVGTGVVLGIDPLVAQAVGAGDHVLVFGGQSLPEWTGVLRRIPALHVAGAALATTICTIFEVLILLVPLRHMSRAMNLPAHVDHRWNRGEVARAFRIGLPIGLQMGAEVGVFALVALLAARVGTLQLAAHQVAIGLASFTFTIAVGIASAGSVRV